jgi:hypothetical protein
LFDCTFCLFQWKAEGDGRIIMLVSIIIYGVASIFDFAGAIVDLTTPRN